MVKYILDGNHEILEEGKKTPIPNTLIVEQLNDFERLKDVWIKHNHELEQKIGRFLGYPKLYPIVSDVDNGTICTGELIVEDLVDELINYCKTLMNENDELHDKLKDKW